MPENHIKSETQHTLPTPALADFNALAPSRFAGLIKVCGVGFLFYYIEARTTWPRQRGISDNYQVTLPMAILYYSVVSLLEDPVTK